MTTFNWNQYGAALGGGVEFGTKSISAPDGEQGIMDVVKELSSLQKNEPIYDGHEYKKRSEYTLPEISRGEAPQLTKKVEVWTLYGNNFYTRELLPVIRTDKFKVKMTKWIFEPSLADQVNEQGRVRYQSAKMFSMQAITSQYGKGLRLPMEMLMRPEGMEFYEKQLLQMLNAVNDTNSFLVIVAILRTYSATAEMERRLNKLRGKLLHDVFRDERDLFGIVQRHKTPMEIIETIIGENQIKLKGRGDTYLVHQKMASYLTQVTEAYTSYEKGGPRADQIRRDGIDSFQQLTRDARAYIVRSYQVDEGTIDIDVLLKYVAYGEYNEGFDRFRNGSYQGYSSAWRDIQIFDLGRDSWQTIGLKYMLDNCGRFDINNKRDGGRMISMNSRLLQYGINFDPIVNRDSLHFKTADPKTGAPVYVPCEYFGQIDPEHFTAGDIMNFAYTSLQNMPDIWPMYTESRAHAVIAQLIAMVEKMESFKYDKDANDFLELVILSNGNGNAVSKNTGVGLKPLTDLVEWRPNQFGVLDLPDYAALLASDRVDIQEKANRIRDKFEVPPFYGSFNGLQYIASLYKAYSHDPAALKARYGLRAESAKDAAEGVALIRSICTHLRRQCPNSVAVSPAYCSSWWHIVNSETVFFDTVIWQHRAPMWLYKDDTKDVGSNAGDSAQAASGISANVLRFVQETFTGTFNNTNTAIGDAPPPLFARSIVLRDAPAPAGAAPAVALPAGRAVQAGTTIAAVSAAPALSEQQFVANLSAQIAREKQALTAYRRLLLLASEARKVPVEGTKESVLRQLKISLLLLPFNLLKLDDVYNEAVRAGNADLSAEAQRVLAGRINYVLDNYVAKFGALGNLTVPLPANGMQQLLDELTIEGIIAEFRSHLDATLSGAANVNPYRANNAQSVSAAMTVATRLRTQADDVLVAIEKDRVSTSRQIPLEKYRRAPLVYSPVQLETHQTFASTNAKNLMAVLSNPVFPDEPMAAMQESTYAVAVRSALTGGLHMDSGRALPAPLRSGRSSAARVSDTAPYRAIKIQSELMGDRAGGRKRKDAEPIGRGDASIEESILGSLPESPTSTIGVNIDKYERISRNEGFAGQRAASAGHADEFSIGAPETTVGGRRGGRGTVPGAAAVQGAERASLQSDLSSLDSIDYSLTQHMISEPFTKTWADIASQATDVLRSWIARVYMMTPIRYNSCLAFIQNNLVFPFSFLLFRPNIQFATYPIIKMVRGPETGNSFLGNIVFTRGDDSDLRILKAKLTYYFAARVFEPTNVYIANNVYITDYFGGMGTTPINPFKYNPRAMSVDDGDIAVILEPYTLGGEHDESISITGRPTLFGRVLTELNPKSAIDYFNAPFYNKLYGWQSVRDEMSTEEHIHYYKFSDFNMNRIVHRGPTKFYVPQPVGPGSFNALRIGAGFFETKYYTPGMRAVCQGRLHMFNEFDPNVYQQV